MGVEVDEARGDGEPADVDLLAAGALGDRSVEGHDASAIDPDVAVAGRRTRSVVAGRVADDEVDHGTLTSLALGGRVSHVNAGRTG